jgi:hypothetical protein
VEEMAAQESDLSALRVAAESATQGILAEAGINNDVTYSRQRADEITLRLAETERTLKSLQFQAREAQLNVGNEVRRSDLMQCFRLLMEA